MLDYTDRLCSVCLLHCPWLLERPGTGFPFGMSSQHLALGLLGQSLIIEEKEILEDGESSDEGQVGPGA